MWAELALEAQTPVCFLEEGVWSRAARSAAPPGEALWAEWVGWEGLGWRDQGLEVEPLRCQTQPPDGLAWRG